jgi:benzoyl-CoA reductase/2-hydroxyglutaryl-CoA dehydratase subunit BcrC/BadD/HgdB
MPEGVSIELYGRILDVGARFSGNAGLRINSVLAQVQRDCLRQEICGEKQSVWSSPLVPSEILTACDLISVTPETVSAILASAGGGGKLLDAADALTLSTDCCSFQRAAAAALESALVPLPQAFLSTTPICDDNPQLASYLANRHGRKHFLIDVPTPNGQDTLSYVISQLEDLIGFLEDLTGRPFRMERLAVAARESNLARTHWLAVNRIRRDHSPVMYGVGALRLAGGMLLQKFGLRALTHAMADYVLELEGRLAARAFVPCRKRLLWLHLFPLYDREFMGFLEQELGLVVVFEESSHLWWDVIDPADPLTGLARRILSNPLGSSVARRLEVIRKLITDYRVDGVVHFSHLGCKSLTSGVPFLARALRREGVPFLELSGDCIDNRSSPKAMWRTRLEAFAEILD